MSGRIRLSVAVGRALRRCALWALICGVAWASVAATAAAQTTPPAAGEPAIDLRFYTAEEQMQLVGALDKSTQAVELFGQGKYPEAIALAEDALAVYRRILGEEHSETATLMNNLGVMLTKSGDYSAALGYLEDAARIRRKVLGAAHPDTASSLNNLGSLQQAMGDFAAAQRYLDEAAAIRGDAPAGDGVDAARSLNNKGDLLRAQGDFDGARTHFEQALAICRESLPDDHPLTAAVVNNLGGLLYATHDFNGARPHLEEALAICRRVFGDGHLDTARSMNNLASLLLTLGDSAAAQPLFVQALAINRNALGNDHLTTAGSLSNLGGLWQLQGDYAAARSCFEEALAIVTRQVEAAAIAQDEAGQLAMSRSVQFYLDAYLSSHLHAGDRRGDEAYRAVLNWKGATLVRQRAIREVADNAALAPLLAELHAVVREWSALMVEESNADPARQEQLATLTREKARLELELSSRSTEFRAATAELPVEELQRLFPADVTLVDFFEFSFNQPKPGELGGLEHRRWLVAFVVRQDGDVRMVDLGEVAFIDLAIDQWRNSFGTSAEGQAAGALLRERLWTPLEEALGDAKVVLVSPDGLLGKLPFVALPGRAPGKYLIEDVAIALVPVPWLIPELMRADGGGADADREVLVVGGVDYNHREAGASVAVAPDDFDADARSRTATRDAAEGVTWNALPGTSGEAAEIGGLFSDVGEGGAAGVLLLDGAAATEERFRALAPTSRVLHVATHGFFAREGRRSALAVEGPEADSVLGRGISGPRVPIAEILGSGGGFPPGLLSGIVLAGANDPPALPEDSAAFADLPEDGILTAEELAFLRLGDVELAVLSACETGLGKVAGGEGLLGIQRAFQVAGVRTTVASLWKVDDVMTQRLMTTFYRDVLEGGQSRLDALRNAQLEMLRMSPEQAVEILEGAGGLRAAELAGPAGPTAPARISPRFWAAFTLSGDWR
jgi:CHAT domain-containing protein/tetratricopeptide (TPR) repeat protein